MCLRSANAQLIRIFKLFLNLYQNLPAQDNGHALKRAGNRQKPEPATRYRQIDQQETLMGKLGLSLIGFLLLAIAVGLLGTISPY
ncbi:hypothetical protein YA0032_21175 [Pseudomonas amygdali]|uniref:Uncharacterized protein n=2 Tax=Pseudomonas syringae group TaxID=136849 RepID=A0AB35R5R4_PSEA0|nr:MULTISPECIES: hypothetical protein [Pseudomonas syringae group]MBD1108296.1 hypothetical protein [Pseudomonas amygdali pv. morsprunorum]MBI6731529.1 hypothetical protein [Pseudomonas amygdali]MBI6813650.1 hypothetical protein [Pseudomonas amygdali]MDT3225702.1 hypothetical protein [Pseudomonas amygdali pv. morsprunorum]MDT3243562.1 hypothetical protein [Pseudomonas amygdali pv. morsprunorum]